MVCWSTAVQRSRNEDEVVIEPQVADYWPRTPPLGNAEVLVLSRFAYMRRRGDEMVLESPRAGALFRICDPKIAAALAVLSTPQQVGQLRRQDGFPGLSFSPCWRIARSFSRSMPPTTATSEPPRAIMTSFFGTFTICCSTRAARRAGTPTRSADLIHMQASPLRRRRCGAAGPERRSICASSRSRMQE